MSTEKSVVSLKLQSGERFDEISVGKPEWTLAQFLDQALKRLEVGLRSAGSADPSGPT